MSGASDRDILALGRWKSSGMLKRYTHLRPSHLQDVVNRISGFGNGRKTAVTETTTGSA
jgi:hypothetical protein